MTTPYRFVIALAVVAFSAVPTGAQDLPKPIQMAVNCAPAALQGSVPSDAPRIIGAQDPSPRALYGARELLVVNAGTGRGVQLGQQFFIRRRLTSRNSESSNAAVTSGRLSVVAVNETTAIGIVDFACDGIDQGDYLEPYVAASIPADAGRTDAGGELDFTAAARLVTADFGRTTAGVGDLMIADVGQEQGAAPGARFAIYRDVRVPGMPLAAVGEGIVISTSEDTSLVRVTRTRDVVLAGDFLIPRKR